MKDVLSTLNKEQRVAVETTEGPVLVLSGAGTGKTRVLVTRVAHIFNQGLARPWEVLALTFTNKAANEMKSRIAEFGQICEWCGTFHSICLKILRRNAAATGLRSDFLIFGEDEQKAVLKTVISALGFDIKKYNPSEWVNRISFYKDTVLADKKMPDDFNKIYDAYNRELDRLGGLDFGDIINRTIKMFSDAPDVLDRYRRQFKYIMVDEYQDTNVVQNMLLKVLSGDSDAPNICCVGDDDQSIYSWRGAEIKNILHFAREYPGAKIIRLEQNYRSTGHILAAANSLIKNNAGRLGKDLRAVLGDGEKIRIASVPGDYDEAREVARRILNGGGNYSNYAVLIRSGSLSRLLEEEFARNIIPYRLVGAMKFYDRMEVRDVIAYVRLMCFPFDDLSFARVISKPRRGIGDTTVDAIRNAARKNNISMFDAMKKFPLKPKQAASAAEFLNAFDFNWQNMPPADAVETLLDRTGYAKMWTESTDVDRDDRQKNIRELIRSVIAKFDNLHDFLEQVSLMIADPSPDGAIEDGEDFVSIMTIHAAKGLEFDTVFLPAWEEGVFPNELSISEDCLEEERRLAYVALTRAKNHCIILHASSRLQFGSYQYNPPSRFIAEIDERFLDLPKVESGPTRRDRNRSLFGHRERSSNVGKLITHPEFGRGVVIDQGKDHYIVAFKNGIKKIASSDL